MCYCTLFDKNYSDKGIVMINSLIQCNVVERIYVLAMDIICENILKQYYSNLVEVISLAEFMDVDLERVKINRTNAEFCWSCTAKLIKYILVNKNEKICTYVDSDLFFYQNPSILREEMLKKNKCVQVISHNFSPNLIGKIKEKQSGKHCVQFNTFTNSFDSMELLNKWIDQCINDCSIENGGDQKYISEWDSLPFVDVSLNEGAGLAPWNIGNYKLKDNRIVKNRFTGKEYSIVFYHFQNLTYYDRYKLCITPFFTYLIIDTKLIESLYVPYINLIEKAKSAIEVQFNYLPLIVEYLGPDARKPKKTLKEKINYYRKLGWIGFFNRIKVKILIKTRIKKYIYQINVNSAEEEG